MGQKVHPYGFRLGITTDHVSRWFSDSTKKGQRYAGLRHRGHPYPSAID
jgi:small subunit ribosomal protein S3